MPCPRRRRTASSSSGVNSTLRSLFPTGGPPLRLGCHAASPASSGCALWKLQTVSSAHTVSSAAASAAASAADSGAAAAPLEVLSAASSRPGAARCRLPEARPPPKPAFQTAPVGGRPAVQGHARSARRAHARVCHRGAPPTDRPREARRAGPFGSTRLLVLTPGPSEVGKNTHTGVVLSKDASVDAAHVPAELLVQRVRAV